MASSPSADDYTVALAQYIKSKRAEVRLSYSLMADAEIARNIGDWRLQFELNARTTAPSVLDFESEARRRLSAGA